MATDSIRAGPSRNRIAVVLLMLVVLLGTAGVSILKHKGYAEPEKLVDDDYVWLYMTSAALGREQVFLNAWNPYVQEATRVGADVLDAAAPPVGRSRASSAESGPQTLSNWCGFPASNLSRTIESATG